ncbi:MAG: DNA-3-methyladenine glycosylase [Methylacidiphilales bacterium]|nr:DNA-3-methyladenine glycosylase [Candidatus Methylacidiphilales bacterium]
MKKGAKLDGDFYLRGDVVRIAKELLGKSLVTQFQGKRTSGMIVETEAYCGTDDRACHANNGRRTARNDVMYGPGGHAYVYLCYGLHHLFNVVTNREGRADAVLIRALVPLERIDVMLRRRKMKELQPRLASGPGALTEALGIRVKHNRTDLSGASIWIEDCGIEFGKNEIWAGPRVGVSYAGEHSLRPWRFCVKTKDGVIK